MARKQIRVFPKLFIYLFWLVDLSVWLFCIFKWRETFTQYFLRKNSAADGPHENVTQWWLIYFLFSVWCDASNGGLDQTEAFHGRPGWGQSCCKSSRHHIFSCNLCRLISGFTFLFLFLLSRFYIQTLSASFSWQHPCLCLVCVLDPWWPLSCSSSLNSGEGLNSRIWQSFEVCSEHLTYPNSFVSYKLLSSRHQCGSNSSWHPVSPLPDPGECPASWPADDGEDQS